MAILALAATAASALVLPRVGYRGQGYGQTVDIDAVTASPPCTTLTIFGTYAADFNTIEYGQKLRHYLPKLKERGVERVCFVVNAKERAALEVASLLDLPEEVEVYSDPAGDAGRAFGVSRGWKPDEELGPPALSPYLKLLGMLVGLGAGATLPNVIGGYLGNPWAKQGAWVETALAQHEAAGRWALLPNVVELDGKTVTTNKFAELPLVSGWGLRPLELATLRLQNMIGISLGNWEALKPDDSYLDVLTQLGGCVLVGEGGSARYEFRDGGICNTADFEELLAQSAKPAVAA